MRANVVEFIFRERTVAIPFPTPDEAQIAFQTVAMAVTNGLPAVTLNVNTLGMAQVVFTTSTLVSVNLREKYPEESKV